jgi:hypothetical protein
MSEPQAEGTFYWDEDKLYLSCGCWFDFDAGTYDLFESTMCEKHDLKRVIEKYEH